jgi:hypothetical protein
MQSATDKTPETLTNQVITVFVVITLVLAVLAAIIAGLLRLRAGP